MFKFQNYLKNLDSTDKLGIQEVDINNAVLYSGNVNIIKNNIKSEEDDSNQPLAAAIVGLNNTAAPLPKNPKFFNAWTDIDALELFLDSKPTCYLILGKPGAGAYSLGEGISKKLNCIHLNPKNIITDEMEQKSSTGICIDFNMKNNKAITFEVFLKMLKIKLESPAIQHRGYIISGFPLVTSSRNPKYLINPLNGEDAVEIVNDLLFDTIANLKKKKPKVHHSHSLQSSLTSGIDEQEGLEEAVDEELEPEEALPEEEEELRVELPKFLLNTCTDIIHPIKAYYNSKKTVLLQQLNDLFSLKLKPDIVIYLSCPDKDLVTKKSHKYINYKNNKQTFEPFTAKVPLDIRWPARYTTSDYLVPFDSHTFNSKYSCVQPINFKHKSIEQMCNYKHDIFPFLEKKLKDFDPKYVIKIDARLTLHEMIHNVSEVLFMMSIMPVLIPEPLVLQEPPDDMEEFWTNVEGQSIIDNNEVTFKRSASLWYNRCPVELKKRHSVKGKPKLAVTFSKYIYITASLDNMISFCRNPRPYLKLKYLEPTCRIIVIGTKSSGKTMISECLSWLFDTPILNYDDLIQTEIQKKYDTYARTILSEIIATIEDARYEIWLSTDLRRLNELNEWCMLKILLLKTYIPFLKEYKRLMTSKKQPIEKIVKHVVEKILKQIVEHSVDQIVEQTVEPIEKTVVEEEETPDIKFLNDFNTIRSRLSPLPFLDDVDACENALAVDAITPYAPKDLITPKEKPKLPTLSDEDVKKAIEAYIIANELQKEMQPTTEEIMNELIKIITSIDADCQKDTERDVMYGKYIIDGFPTASEYWGYLAESKLLPDYTIALIENREIEPELIKNYKYLDRQIKNHQERYVLAKDPLVKVKLKIKNTSTPENRIIDMKMILHDIIETSYSVQETADNLEPDTWVTFADNVEKFKEDWDSIKIKLDEYEKCVIEVELGDKSDIQVVEEVLIKLRKGYFISCAVSEEDEPDDDNDEDESPKDIMTYNSPQNFGEIGVYCPISYYNHGILWEGKPEFSVKFNKKLYRLCKQEYSELFQNDVLKYESYNKPFKALPPLRICVIGCIGSGKTTISKLLAKELGVMHIDFSEVINDFLFPKHFKKVGRQYENAFTDVPIDDEAVTEFQMDEDNENLISDILSHETELRKIIFNYFERGAPILPQLMQRVITKLWFQEPFRNTGFILDGYPRLPTDIEDMTSSYCIPDLIIEIDVSSESALKRLSTNMLKTWKMQLSEAKEKARQKLVNERKEWMDFLAKNIVAKLIYDEILENMFFLKGSVKQLSNESVILDANPSGSIVDSNLFSTYNEMIKEFPEPEDQSTWEKADEVREKIEGRIEGIYESDYENIQAIKDLLMEQKIKTVTINGNRALDNVTRSALSKLTNLRNRCESFFEETFIISDHIADTLLIEGFCLLSKFNKICPVYMVENPNAIINYYSINKLKGRVFPVIHRSYLYFICGEDSVKKFRTNPLKYITCSNICDYNEYPLRIGVIGAPKSGKSLLSAKLAARYGLICLSRGIAVRNVLDTKHWSELGTKMLSALTSGDCINSGYVMKAVQSMAMDHRTKTNGFVFDGFPETGSEAMELVNDGIYPNIVFDISADIEKVVENSQKEVYYDILKRNPPYSRSYIKNRYRTWKENSYNVREWINSDYQNVYVLDGNKSRWQCLHDAVKVIDDFVPKAHFYLTNVQSGIVPAHVMCISNDSFEKNMSNFRNLCPLCLRKNVLKHNLYPVDKKGVVQYKNVFYWICPQHTSIVLKDPHLYLEAQNIGIPELPAMVKIINPNLVYEKGVCIVTYAEHLPAQIPKPGTNKYAASFHGNTYLFCSQTCLDKFMAKPHLYYDITVFKEANLFQPISLKGLPNIGYLEQTVGNLITEACCSVNVFRPKYPGLSFELSGLLHIALYLKTHDPLMDKARLPMYLKASKNFDAVCKLIKDVALFLRSMDNPFAHYPLCCNVTKHDTGTVKNASSYSTSSAKSSTITSEDAFVSRVPVPDERYDYLVEYHKPVSKVPAFLNVVDIAGLVKGAAEGQGLGNAFLSHIKACDAIFNLCRAFDDEDVIHVDGDVNPVRDLETIGEELRLKDEEQLMANFDKLDRVVSRGGDKKLKPEYDALTRIKAVLVDEKKHIRFGDWSAADIEVLNKYLFLTSKPALYLVNLSEKDYIRKKNKWLPKLKEWIDKNDPGAPLIPFSGVLESKLMEMDAEERKAYLKEHNITSALEKIIVQGYKALSLEYFFTAGADEVKAWTIQKGTKAPQAAGRIHTDFEKGFIMAEVMHYKDFKEEGSEPACKSAGKYRQQGRNYVVEDGDIIFFKFNAGAGLKDAKKK